MKLPSFNSIANVVSIASGVSLAGIIGVGSYVYLNKDAIIQDVKDAAIESVLKNVGGAAGSLGGGALTGDVGLPMATQPQPSAPAPQATPSEIPNF